MAYQIGQYFKSNDYKNTQDNQNRPGEQSLQHLMAHAILGAATSYATEQNIGIGALSAASSEAAAPALSKFLFGKDSKELTQDEKDTITNIITLATASTAYAITDGDVSGSVNAAEIGKGAVENNSSAEMVLEAEREAAWILANGDKDKYFELMSLQGQIKIVVKSIESAHWKYNDMTIINISGGVAGHTIVINNKNGQVFTSGHPDINAASLSSILSAGASVSFGSIVGGIKDARAIDKVIEGPSFATEVCKVLCVGRAVNLAGDKVNTYGVGLNVSYGVGISAAKGVSASGSTMIKTDLVLISEQIKQLFGR